MTQQRREDAKGQTDQTARPPDRGRSLPVYLLAFVLYLLIACIVTYPLVLNLPTRLAGFVYGDAHEMAHHIWWFTQAIRNGQPLFYQPLLAYPDGIDGITLWANPLQFFPAWGFALLIGVPAAYNLTLLLTLALNGTAAFALMRSLLLSARIRIGGEGYAAFVAGVVFVLYPTMQGHLGAGHAGLLVQWTFALYALALLKLADSPPSETDAVPRGRAARQILIAACLFVASGWGHTLQILYATLPLTAVVLLALLVRRDWKAMRRILIALIVGGAALGIFLIPVAQATFGTAAYADEGGFIRYSADLLAPLTPSFLHPVYGMLDYPRQVLGVNLDEGAAYVGIVGGILALIGLIRRYEARRWLILAALAFVLSLGPLLKVFDQPVTFTTDSYASGVALPFAYLASLPVVNLARTPGRFNFGLALAVALMAGYGASVLLAPRRAFRETFGRYGLSIATTRGGGWLRKGLRHLTRAVMTLVLVALIAFDYQTFFPLPTIPADVPDAIAALGDRSDLRAVLDLPVNDLVAAKDALFLQTAHHHPLIAGQVTRRTPVSPAKLAILEGALDPALLRSVGADIVIVHREQDGGGILEARARQQLGDPVYLDGQYAVFETPPVDEAPAPSLSVQPPDSFTADLPLYVYVPQPVGVLLTAAFAADGRDVIVRQDDQQEPLARWTINGSAEASLFIGLDAGFHTIWLTLGPPCLTPPDATLSCRAVRIDHLTLEPSP